MVHYIIARRVRTNVGALALALAGAVGCGDSTDPAAGTAVTAAGAGGGSGGGAAVGEGGGGSGGAGGAPSCPSFPGIQVEGDAIPGREIVLSVPGADAADWPYD